MKNLWATGPEEPEETELSETELLTLAFGRMMDGVWPFEEVHRASLTDRLTRWQQSQEQYITILREEIAESETSGRLQRLKKNYEVASKRSLDDEEHPCHSDFVQKRKQLRAAEFKQQNTSKSRRDSGMPSASSTVSFLT
jgi:hypothetical protein